MSDNTTPKGTDSELNPEVNEKYNFIKSALYDKLYVNKVIFKLIYKASRDGDSSGEFHSKWYNINNTLIIIKTKENNIFGGFTTALLNCTNNYKYDTYSFLFSLNKNKIYSIKSNFECAIGSWKGSCVSYGASGCLNNLFLGNRFLSRYDSYVYNGTMYFDQKAPAFVLNNGMRNFIVKECEIYQVIPQIE